MSDTRKQYFVNVPNAVAEIKFFGRATRDVEARFTPSGAKVANVSMAVARRWNDDGEWKEKTSFYNVAVWAEGADRAAAIKKGDIVMVECSAADLEAEVYTNGSGEPKASLKITRANVYRMAYAELGEAVEFTSAEPGGVPEGDIEF